MKSASGLFGALFTFILGGAVIVGVKSQLRESVAIEPPPVAAPIGFDGGPVPSMSPVSGAAVLHFVFQGDTTNVYYPGADSARSLGGTCEPNLGPCLIHAEVFVGEEKFDRQVRVVFPVHDGRPST